MRAPSGRYIPLVMVILGFLTIPWLGPKDKELRAPSIPKAKLGHTDCVRHHSQRRSQDTRTVCAISPKGEARTHRLRAPSVPKVKLGYLDCLWTVLEFCTLSEGGHKIKVLHKEILSQWFFLSQKHSKIVFFYPYKHDQQRRGTIYTYYNNIYLHPTTVSTCAAR